MISPFLRIALMTLLMPVSGVVAQKAELPEPSEKRFYKEVGGTSLEIWIWKPADWKKEDKRSAVVFYHGGGWKGGSPSAFARQSAKLAEKGMVAFSVQYRLTTQPGVTVVECVKDARSAYRWVKAHAADYKVDVNRIAIIGESAGGHLVSWLGVTGEGETRVAAVVPFYAPQDLVAHVKRRNELRGLGDLIGSPEMSEANFAKLAAMSPITQVKPGLPPFLQIHGDADTTVAHEQSVMFEKAMKAAGNRCETITIPGGGHGMGGWAKLNSDYAARMIDWLRTTLK